MNNKTRVELSRILIDPTAGVVPEGIIPAETRQPTKEQKEMLATLEASMPYGTKETKGTKGTEQCLGQKAIGSCAASDPDDSPGGDYEITSRQKALLKRLERGPFAAGA